MQMLHPRNQHFVVGRRISGVCSAAISQAVEITRGRLSHRKITRLAGAKSAAVRRASLSWIHDKPADVCKGGFSLGETQIPNGSGFDRREVATSN
jgi:hypothetical protein